MQIDNKTKAKHVYAVPLGIATCVLLGVGIAFIPTASVTSESTGVSTTTTLQVVTTESIPIMKRVQTPEAVKAIYMSACVVGTKDFRQQLVDLIAETELNAVVIDIKDFSGTISFAPKNAQLQFAWDAATCGARDMEAFIASLHEQGIYVIGRITVFQDPLYTKKHPELAVQKESDKSVWKDHKGLSFIEVGAKPYWEYIVALARDAYAIGFDELNFDYVRFPSDGNMRDIYFPFSQATIDTDPEHGKAQVLESFFRYLDGELRAGKPADVYQRPIISADLFGMTTTNTNDLNIGQIQERALPYFDFIAPMVYPSHYPPNFNGWANPNEYPYELIHFVMSEGVARVEAMQQATTTPPEIKARIHTQQLRPWLQDFDYGGEYGPKEVRAQINATYDAGLTSWMLWAPSNRYTKEALLR